MEKECENENENVKGVVFFKNIKDKSVIELEESDC